jgi:Peptidase family C25
VACLNASWVNLDRPFAKAWVTRTVDGKNAGALAYYGGSVTISWDEPAVMSVGIAKSHFEKPVHSLGGTVLAGQLYLQAQMGTGDNTLENMKWYNLFGDPSLLIRTATPVAYRVKSQSRQLNGDTVVTVTVNDEAGSPLKDVSAALSVSGNPLTAALTNASGQALLTVAGVETLEPDTLLTTTGYNMETVDTLLQ